MTKIKFKPTFVKTQNVRHFEYLMDGLALGAGEGRLGLVYGRAGRGKTRTSQWYAAHQGCIYLRVAAIWRTSEIEFLKSLCRELEILEPPHRKGPCFAAIVDRMLADPRPVFIDELEKLPRHFLDVVRDISDMSTAPIILIGEEELLGYMRQNRRVWSRIFQQLAFDPISPSDVILYAAEAAGLKLTVETAKILHSAAEGDFRLVRRDLLMLIHLANSKGVTAVDEKLVKMAVKRGINGA